MSDEAMSRAPWTAQEVAALNRWQSGPFHPFTCPRRDRRILVATEQGWVCPDCDYTQDWAHGFMLQSRDA